MNNKKLLISILTILSIFFIINSSYAASLADRLAGYILLQVEENGEAWYVDTDDHKRYYMKDGGVAYDMMRNFGLGITSDNLSKIPVGIEDRFQDGDSDGDGLADKLEEGLGTDINNSDTDGDGYMDGNEVKNDYNPLGAGKMLINTNLADNLQGKILLQVESRGEAWYVSPNDGKRYYMKDGDAAYQIMRFLSLGITNNDLSLIEANVEEAIPSFQIIYESTNGVNDTDIYDNIITWQENNNIYYLDINIKTPIQITNDGGNTSAKVYKKNIVYYNFNEECISLYNIENKTTIEVGSGLEKCKNPFIYDDKVVWTSYVGGIDQGYGLEGGLWNIHIYDIPSKQIIKNIETSIGPTSWAQKPIIFGSKIVWSERISNQWEVYMYDLDISQKIQITTDGDTSTQPFIFENKIIYSNSLPADAAGIYMHDLNSGIKTKITNNLAQPINSIVMNNENIFWVDTRSSHLNHDIYYHNLNTGEEYHFADDSNYYEVSPATYLNKVVYTRNHVSGSGNEQIILATTP